MRIQLAPIGNSQGIRLPKAVIQQAGLTPELELEVRAGEIVIRPARKPRDDWQAAAKACRAADEDRLADWDAAVGDFAGEWR